MIPIDGFEIVVDQHMAGMKKAVRMGKRIAVSPAMYALMKDATQEELRHLFSNLHVIVIPELDFEFGYFMTTRP